MSKSARSISLPDRAGINTDRAREVRTALKSSDNKRPFEKGTEVEESFGRNSLSFRVDKMTLQQRKIIMERQKNIADENMVNEINCFSNMLKQLTDNWQESEITEISARMSAITDGLKQKIGMLSQNAVNLGSLRQECSSSGRVLVITDYVDLMKERKMNLHKKVLDTKKTLVDNKIELDSHYPESKSISVHKLSEPHITTQPRTQQQGEEQISVGKSSRISLQFCS